MVHAFTPTDSEEQSDSSDSFSADEDDTLDGETSFGFMATAEHIIGTRALASVGIAPRYGKYSLDSGVVDSGSSTISTLGEHLVPSAQYTSTRNTAPDVSDTFSRGSIGGVGNVLLQTKGTMPFWFIFGGIEYLLTLQILSGSSQMLLSHFDMDRLGINYQSLYKLLERPSDWYSESAEMRNGVPHMLFQQPSFF